MVLDFKISPGVYPEPVEGVEMTENGHTRDFDNASALVAQVPPSKGANLNSDEQIRNPKQYLMTKIQMTETPFAGLNVEPAG